MKWLSDAVIRRQALGACLCAAALALSGCASDRRAGARAAYDAGNYRDAYYQALAEERARGSAQAQTEGALTAGLSAYALAQDAENEPERERWLDASANSLQPLVDHPDPTVSGRACATLGLGEALKGNFSRSANLLDRAAVNLEADEGARAALHAGLSYDLAGSDAAARRSYQAALAKAQDPALRAAIQSRMSGTAAAAGYTIQIGAFASEPNARRAAADAERKAAAAGLQLGSAEVVSGPGPSGRTLHRVRIGSFPSRQEALAARLRFAPAAAVTGVGR
ncbi:MAG: SPOR domain-containing protein [Phycisphaerales bacterium]